MTSVAKIEHGWVRVPFDGQDIDRCYLAIANPEPTEDDWRPAYKAVEGGRRVIQARVPEGLTGTRVVWSKVNGYVERVAVVTL